MYQLCSKNTIPSKHKYIQLFRLNHTKCPFLYLSKLDHTIWPDLFLSLKLEGMKAPVSVYWKIARSLQ